MLKRLRTLSWIITIAALLSVAGWFLYAPALRAPFVFDDFDNIVNNPRIRLNAVTADSLTGIVKNQFGNRPLVYVTFALNYYFGRYDVRGFHVVNLAIHVITALLVFLIARLTPGVGNSGTALLAAALWLVNPVHTQSVTYIVQRMNALSAMFVLLSLACYLLARRTQPAGKNAWRPVILLTGSGLAGLLGLLSKETAAILPVIIFLYEWYFLQNLDRSWFKKQLRWIGVTVLLLAAVSLVYLGGNPAAKLTGMYAKLDFTMGQRLLTEPQVVLYYLTLLLFPHPARLNLDYNFPAALSPINPAVTLPAILALLALAAAAVYAARKHRLLSFAIVWYLAALLIESSFIGLDLIFEHRAYLPSVFPAIAAASFLTGRVKPRALGVAAVMTAMVIGGLWTWQRNRVWADPPAFWQDGSDKSPHSARILNNLGTAYKEINKIEEAIQAFEEALIYDPEWISALNNLGTIRMDQGRHEEALKFFEKALEIEPGYYDAHYNRGLVLMNKGDLPVATREFQETLRLNPLYEKAHNNLGAALMRQLDPDQAIVHFQRTLELDPYFVKAYSNMGIAYFKKGLTDKAMDCFNRALDIDPLHMEAYNNRQRVRSQIEKYGNKIGQLEQSHGRDPDNPRLSFLLAEVYREAGLTHLALRQYEETLSLQPDAIDCLINLGNLYAAHYQYQRAADAFEQLSALRPEAPSVHYNLACLYALQNQTEKAVNALEKAVEKGYDNWNQIASDKDLENIRDTEYFKKIATYYQGEKGE